MNKKLRGGEGWVLGVACGGETSLTLSGEAKASVDRLGKCQCKALAQVTHENGVGAVIFVRLKLSNPLEKFCCSITKHAVS